MNRSRQKQTRFVAATILSGVMAFALSPGLTTAASPQKESIPANINKGYQNPNVDKFVQRFEHQGREIYDKREQVIQACGICEGMSVADIGAGTGLFTRLFAAKVGPKGRVYAVDVIPKFVKHIQQTAKKQNLTNIVGIVCEPDSTKLPAGSIDVAFICDTYHHFEYPEKTMKSIWNALRANGILYVIDFRRIEGVSPDWIVKHVRGGKDVFKNEIEGVGFQLVDEPELFKSNYCLKFRKIPSCCNSKQPVP